MRFNTLHEWLAWQEQLHPETIELGLERIRQVWQKLHTTAFTCPIISVAGTNGKGSSVAMLQEIYHSAGYRVGTYTSPHLWLYNERIKLDGVPVDDETICAAFERIDKARGDISLTYFEFGTLAALEIFKNAQPDVIILEVGLGGRLDAVNIIDADVSLITRIDLDHQQWLGNDRESIAQEKAGIMRSGKPAVVSDPDMPHSIRQVADEKGSVLFISGQDFDYQIEEQQWRWQAGDSLRSGLPLPNLRGQHQLQNAAGVLMVAELLQQQLPVNQSHIRNGLLNATQPGRFTIVPGDPEMVLDVAHNGSAVEQLAANLQDRHSSGHLHVVFSCLADKAITDLVKPLCNLAYSWYLAQVDAPRAASLSEIKDCLETACPSARMESHASVSEALVAVRKRAQPGDRLLVYGSFYTVAEAMQEGL